MLLIDPPSGWLYGFPKPYDNPNEVPMFEWLIDNGLPHELAELADKYGCRFWEEPTETE